MPLSLIFAFWSVSILFVITPGADWAYSISAGLQHRRIIPAVVGLLCGHLGATIIVAAGVGALIAKAPIAMTLLTLFGALYLIWLGIGLLRQPAMLSSGNGPDTQSAARWALKGFYISGLNPKVFLLFLAIMPQFTIPNGAWTITLQILVLGAIHVANCASVYFLVGYASRILLRTRPYAAKLVSYFSGGLMIMIALILLTEQFLKKVWL
ncbi:LysE family translocator [Tatumella sp. OPLPL6]|uniref:LysE family translocator n=1 Tax=Tatumella sp. OPLPL6 TaxID=1928657 RepID=UPI000C179626|nr:LysE family translocator [Tatumella sp. OPLPL6]PIJ46108.1 lysine transporter LysE [Tatumella sp. OPLPL6]